RQMFALARRIRANGQRVRGVLIGTLEDAAASERVRALADTDDLIITDPAFTTNAAQLLGAADVVFGTGRGLMEAALIGKPVLAPVSGAELPALVTADNVQCL